MLRSLLVLLVLVVAGVAHADVAAAKRSVGNGCTEFTLCSAEADVTNGCDNTSDNIVAATAGNLFYAAYATTSTATTFTCDLYTSSGGYSATARTALTSAGTGGQLSPTNLSWFVTAALQNVWAVCSTAISGGTVTITLLACPAK